ncbi:MAG: DUF2914 domain-containing protein [Elusimicrobia bacterium]|nr:DUF2914 domain-containing protein [Elusimicrobiota bacterium]
MKGLFLILVGFLFSSTYATEPLNIRVEALVARDVIAKQPADPNTVFPQDSGFLVLWTKVTAKQAPTAITHVWYYLGKEVMRVKLDVKSPRYRTWSRKTIEPDQQGKWKAEVLGPDGTVLAAVEFIVEAQKSSAGQEDPKTATE